MSPGSGFKKDSPGLKKARGMEFCGLRGAPRAPRGMREDGGEEKKFWGEWPGGLS